MKTNLDVAKIAAMTPGMVGADLANLVNEAALLAVRRYKDKVTMSEFEEAVERLVAGLEKKNRLINPKEREIVAYHEMGHALVALSLPDTDPVQKDYHYSPRHCCTGIHHAGPYRRTVFDEKNRIAQPHCHPAGRSCR